MRKPVVPPIDSICPSCSRYSRDTQWSNDAFGTAICRKCAMKEELRPPIVAPPVERPESCPRCGRVPRRRRNWILNGDGWQCRRCASKRELIPIGSYRVDAQGRSFIVQPLMKALYPFGNLKMPLMSNPGFKAQFDEQTEAMWAVVETHLYIAKRTALRFVRTGLIRRSDAEEVMQDACVPALCRAAMGYDSTRGEAQFTTYAITCCRRAVLRWARRRTRARPEELIADLRATDAEAARSEERQLDEAAKQHAADVLQEIAHLLSDKDRYVLEQHFVEGRSYRSIGYELGVLPQAVYFRVKRVQKRCMEKLGLSA